MKLGQTRLVNYLPTAERAGSSNVVGGRGDLRAIDDHAEVIDGSTVVVGLTR